MERNREIVHIVQNNIQFYVNKLFCNFIFWNIIATRYSKQYLYLVNGTSNNFYNVQKGMKALVA